MEKSIKIYSIVYEGSGIKEGECTHIGFYHNLDDAEKVLDSIMESLSTADNCHYEKNTADNMVHEVIDKDGGLICDELMGTSPSVPSSKFRGVYYVPKKGNGSIEGVSIVYTEFRF